MNRVDPVPVAEVIKVKWTQYKVLEPITCQYLTLSKEGPTVEKDVA